MAIELKNKTNVIAPNGEYPYGSIKDNDGSNNGTPVNRVTYTDMHQFFARMFEKVKEVYPTFDYNDLPDNAYNGFQYYEALLKTRPCKIYKVYMNQTGSNDPVPTIMPDQNTIGSIVWTRSGTGTYVGTLSGAFPTAAKCFLMVSGAFNGGGVGIDRTSANTVTLYTFNSSGSAADDILFNTALLLEVYP